MSVLLHKGKESPKGKSLTDKIVGKYYRNERKHTERELMTASVTAISGPANHNSIRFSTLWHPNENKCT